MVTGRISFIGAGPGAADLITVRGAKRIAEADIVVWAASLVTPECVQEHARSDAELVDSSRLTHENALEIYRRAERDKLKVARVHSGDPSLWGAVQEQYDAAVRMNVEVEIVPGVPAFSAAAAAIGRELTVPEVAQSLVLTRLEGGKTPMPDGEKVREFAKHGTTMALFLSAARTGQLVEELRAGGYPDDTPVLVAYKVTWPDELLVRSTLGELEADCKKHKLWRHTLFIIGKGLTAGGTRSHLYHAGHFHTYRKADKEARRALRAERSVRRVEKPREQPEESDSANLEESGAANLKESEAANLKESDAAWWAVRDWQETARGAARFGANRSIPQVDESQSQLFADEPAEAETAAPQQESATSSATTAPATAASAANATSGTATDTGGTDTTTTTAATGSTASSGTTTAATGSTASSGTASTTTGTTRKTTGAAKSSSAKRKAPAKPNTAKNKQSAKRKPAAKPDEQSE
ncbi:precorrin-4 C(11)-methyltransferase [Saccharopolyspora aridisoli]|uniref:Precorrin-4 C(11)-methyltransferase n=1 Tax=Saccharopolyspora aridisoli TaxID=2530385 RepID=A0A4R4UW58_9PSEU|nr:precorrin-4 C(11)-methyltransferase [Saccharopolyspora aridisoli]TDC94786.1 precorrin-4 C(11)-methyltransferase [Saccharopolyspora aridisoli]